jgi:NADPH:quinone reductase-like Zn-dependent oxidoreductase
MDSNTALWMAKRGAPLLVGSAPSTRPAADEVVVAVRAVSVNFIDAMPGAAYRVVVPWLTFPAIIGSDVAGEIVEVGSGVTRLRIGDRVLAHAVGLEKSRNNPAEGAFQSRVVLMQHMVSPIPDALSFEQASVLPLQLSTAAVGLFQKDHLGLALPSATPSSRGETVLVWGGSTGVGSNGIQLARNAGYRVVTTCSPRNFDYVKSLGADGAVDRTSKSAVDELVALIGDSPLAGSLAIGSGSLRPTTKVAARVAGSKRVTSAQAAIVARLESIGTSRRVKVSGIWGGSLKDNEVGPAIYVDFLPTALAAGSYKAEPPAVVVGEGLRSIPGALERLRAGVSAEKLVVTIPRV